MSKGTEVGGNAPPGGSLFCRDGNPASFSPLNVSDVQLFMLLEDEEWLLPIFAAGWGLWSASNSTLL